MNAGERSKQRDHQESNIARRLPAVGRLLADPSIAERVFTHGRANVVDAIRSTLDAARARKEGSQLDDTRLVEQILTAIDADGPRLKPVINATGVLLHTGLGRAPFSPEVAAEVARAIAGYSNLEFDLDSGTRGRRNTNVETLLRQLTGAPAALLVNNNAAATLLVLRVVAGGREAIVSRGQLIEIGGEFRLPEIFEVSGARLREVGTTNKTRLADYERAITPDTAALLRVHTSNYRIEGFTSVPTIEDLCRLARSRGIACIDDIGSGALRPGHVSAIGDEPTIAGSLAAGADIVLCSGDKLLGGPQCGLILGSTEWIARLAADPLARALRVDKMTLAALESTLRAARASDVGTSGDVLLWTMIAATPDSLRDRADALVQRLEDTSAARFISAQASSATLGGGSCPGTELESWALRLQPPADRPQDVIDWARTLRLGDPPIVGRIHDGALWLDLLTILPEQDDSVARAVSILALHPDAGSPGYPALGALPS